jgi:hypothetical protein
MQTKKLRPFISLLLLLVLVLANTLVFAQAPSETPSPSPAAAGSQPSGATTPQPLATATPNPSPKVTAVNGNLELDDILEVYIENLQAWTRLKETNDPNKLVPYINGRAIKGNYPEELHLERGRLIFHLQITPESKDAWTDLLGEPSGLKRPVTLSVGLESGSAFDSVHAKDNPLRLTIISPIYGIIALIVIFVTLGLLLWLARKTNIIRETGPPAPAGKRRPYNLGRAQMAFWFFLIYASYTTIWLITSTLDTITASLLALMGISAGTALGEALIDNGKETAKTNQLQDLTAERQALDQTMTEVQSELDKLNAASPLSVTDQANRDALNRQLIEGRTRIGWIDQQVRTINAQSAPTISAGFLRDILSDGSGYSFHRFQIFAWTIILGIIFVSSVYNDLTMPEFSPTLLGLMGLSAGTYIGFKFPEQK